MESRQHVHFVPYISITAPLKTVPKKFYMTTLAVIGFFKNAIL